MIDIDNTILVFAKAFAKLKCFRINLNQIKRYAKIKVTQNCVFIIDYIRKQGWQHSETRNSGMEGQTNILVECQDWINLILMHKALPNCK